MTNYKQALDGAKAVTVDDSNAVHYGLIVVWHGGTTFNVYTGTGMDELQEVDVFNVSDENGRPVDRNTVEHMEDYLERES